VPATRRRTTRALVITAGAAVLASCGGGGGQLAHQTTAASVATTTTGSAASARPSSTSTEPTTSSAELRAIPAHRLPTPRTASATARELDTVETELRGDDRDPARLARLGRRQQLAYRALSIHPDWVARVEQAVPADLRPVVQANVSAGASLSALTGTGTTLPTALPDWTVLAPKAAPTLRAYYDEAQAATGIPWAYLAAVHLVESRVGRIHGPSTAGARGPMQFIPATWATYGEGDINDDHDAILAAGRYLASRGGPSDMARALYSYNNDERYVAAIEAYAGVMLADPKAYDGYHAWRVFFATRDQTYLLPDGYGTE
jgi:hypothetical protein